MAPTLAQKLELRPGSTWRTYGAPPGFENMLRPLPVGLKLTDNDDDPSFGRIIFAVDAATLLPTFDEALVGLPPDGAIWVAWPKKSSGVWSDIGFDSIQRLGLSKGLVDNKVCAIDDVWTALRFVVPLVARPAWRS